MDETAEEELAQLQSKVTPVLAKHFWQFYLGSAIVALLISCHGIFSIFPRPVITDGVSTGVQKAHHFGYRGQWGNKAKGAIYASMVGFTYLGQNYEVVGGWDEDKRQGEPVKVIFDANHPERAREFSLLGFLDFEVFRLVFPIWVILSGFFYAYASADSHFTAFNFNVPYLTLRSFILLSVTVLFMPLFPSVDLLLFGKKADAVMTGDSDLVDGKYLYAIVYNAGGNQYSLHSEYADEYEREIGQHLPVLYKPDNPNRACLYQVSALYANNLSALMGISLLLIIVWFVGLRTPTI